MLIVLKTKITKKAAGMPLYNDIGVADYFLIAVLYSIHPIAVKNKTPNK